MPLSVRMIVDIVVAKITEFLGKLICPLVDGKVPSEFLPVPAIVVEGKKNVYNKTEDPNETNNITEGYTTGSRWINTLMNKEFVCVQEGENAVWRETTQSVNLFGGNSLMNTTRSGSLTSTNSQTYRPIANITMRPAPGLYFVSFSGTIISTVSGQTACCVIDNGGSLVMETEREITFPETEMTCLKASLHTQTMITADGSSVISVLVKSGCANPILLQNYSLVLLRQ